MEKNQIREKIKEIGEIQIPLKTVVLVMAFTVLIVRPPGTWIVTTSQKIHTL